MASYLHSSHSTWSNRRMQAETANKLLTYLPEYRNGSTVTTNGFRQSDVWFPDGNIVLIAEDTAFKIHRGQLERHSDVFRSTFSLPQPRDITNKTIEDCQIIELHDNADDVRHLLRALYDGLYFKKLSADDFQVISSVLKLSTKYFMEHLRERCVSRLIIDWPSTLPGWDSRELEATDAFGSYNPRSRFAHPIYVINFARTIGLPAILPCAFYDLCRYGPSKIVAGVQRKRPLEGERGDTTASQSESHIQLSSSDLHTVLLGREAAQRSVANFIEEELSKRGIAEDCHNKEIDEGRVCKESFYFVMVNLLRSIGGLSAGRDCDPLFTLNQAIDMLSRSDYSDGVKYCSLRICAACKEDFSASVRLARETIWTQIPSWFGMDGFSGERSRV